MRVVAVLLAVGLTAAKVPMPVLSKSLAPEAARLASVPDGGLSGSALCARLEAADAFAARLTKAMNDSLAAVGTNVDGASQAQLAELARQANALRAPGIQAVASNDELDVAEATVDTAALARALRVDPHDAALLKAVAPFGEHADEIGSISQEMVTDVTACTTYEKILPAMKAMDAAWPGGSACVRRWVARRAAKDLAPFTDSICLCDGAKAARAHARVLAREVARIPELGTDMPGRIRAAPLAKAVQFHCAPPD